MMQVQTQVKWVNCEGHEQSVNWCALESVELGSVKTEGVYLIWVGRLCVYVGQGDIADRLNEHRSGNDERSKQILSYRSYGTLAVTWASVDKRSRDGVEAFLAATYKPIGGERRPDVTPIAVNLPFSE